MKNKNKFKLFASTAALAAIAAPIVTLASCSKTPAIVIDEKEKTKELEKGSRQTAFTFTLNSAIATGETVKADLSNIVSSQEGYTIEVTDVNYGVGSKVVKVIASIVPTEDEILKEGTKFTFDITLNRLDSTGKTVATSTFTSLQMTYVSVPTTTGLSIETAKKTAYSNPGSVEHQYIFDVGSTLTIDENCTFECDIENKSTSTSGYSVVFNSAKYDKNLKKLLVTFSLNKMGTEAEEKADFDFTISCQKEGNELWRQKMTGFTITYIYHQMYIFDEIQTKQLSAGGNFFHLYVARNPIIERWDDPDVIPSITFDPESKLQVDGTVTAGYSEKYGYHYFDIPVTINPAATDTDETITYSATLAGYAGEQRLSHTFTNLTIKYIATKITDGTRELKYLDENSKDFTGFKLTESTVTQSVEAEINEISVTGISVTSATVDIADPDAVKITVGVLPKNDEGTAEFNLTLKGKDADGNVIWDQLLTGFKITYIKPIKITSTTIKTDLESNIGYIEFITKSSVSDVDVETSEPEFENPSEDVEKVEITKVTDEDKFKVELTAKDGKTFDANTFVRFSLDIKGKYGPSGSEEEWKSHASIGMSYEGFVTLDEETPAIRTTLPGATTCMYNFNKFNSRNVAVELTDLGGTEGFELSSYVNNEKTSAQLFVTISPKTGYVLQNDAYRNFNVTFKGLDDSGSVVWTRKYTESSTAKLFSITYAGSVSCENKNKYTLPAKKETTFTFENVGYELAEGDYYELEVADQTSASGITVSLEKETIAPTSNKFDVKANLVKESGAEFVDGQSVYFSLIFNRYLASGALVSTQKITDLKATYISSPIYWNSDDSWVSKHTSGSAQVSETKSVSFTLANELNEGEELYAQITQTTPSADAVSLESDYLSEIKVTPTGHSVLIPMNLKTTDTQFNIGDYVDYTIKFTCKKGSDVVWTHSISDTYLTMLSHFDLPTKQITTSTYTGYLYFELGSCIPIEYIYSRKVIISSRAINIRPSKTGLSVELGSNLSFPTPLSMKMPVLFKESTGVSVESGDYVEFDLNLIVTVETDVGTTSIPFRFTDCKIEKD